MRNRAFSLVEISIVIIIFAISLSLILGGRSLIKSAKINSIFSDYVVLRDAIIDFKNNELCIPGECSAGYLTAQGFDAAYTAAASISGGCASGAGIYAFDGTIDTPVKRSCAFSQLQIKGYVYGVVNNPANRAASLTTANNLVSKFSKQAQWDLRTANTANMYPLELSNNLSASPPSAASAAFVQNWVGANALILRNAVYASSTNVADDDIVSPPANTVNSAISPSYAYDLDLKYDDGYPLTGIIISGRNNGGTVNVSSGARPTIGCYGLPTGGTVGTITKQEQYGLSSKTDLANGCVTAFIVSFP